MVDQGHELEDEDALIAFAVRLARKSVAEIARTEAEEDLAQARQSSTVKEWTHGESDGNDARRPRVGRTGDQ